MGVSTRDALRLKPYPVPFVLKILTFANKEPYPAFFRTFAPILNNFRTVPVGSRFI
jgi:hypothetical protein